MSLISVITINRNNATGLKRTLTSVISQSATDFEYIVIDGASTDDSYTLLKNFKISNSNIFSFITEPDNGIYHAMNKGISIATGEFILFLNSGDELASETVLEKVSKTIKKGTDICSGILFLNNSGKLRTWIPPAEISLFYCVYEGLTHPNTFIRKSLFEKYGYYNENQKIVSDWEFFLIVAGLNNAVFQALDFPVAIFYEDGISSENSALLEQETKNVLEKHIPGSVMNSLERQKYLEDFISQSEFKYLIELYQKIPGFTTVLLFPYKILYKIQRYLSKNQM